MNVLGISAGFHDAGVSVVDPDGNILFAAHSERYSKIKNDPNLNQQIIDEALSQGAVDKIAWYERPLYKRARQIYSGEVRSVFKNLSPVPGLRKLGLNQRIQYHNHHLSHAAAGFQTSPFERAIVIVVDAIGEWDTYSVFRAHYDAVGRAVYKRIYRQTYPHSLGLFYSAMTQRAGLKPGEEEYILMGMAAYGRKTYASKMIQDSMDLSNNKLYTSWSRNFHIRLSDDYLPDASPEEIAAAAQLITERCLRHLMEHFSNENPDIDDCVYMGGVALNCVANTQIRHKWNRMWIMPNPGDCGSSLGAAALAYGKQLNWQGPYLGTNIPGEYPVNDILGELQRNGIVGVASGRAEFGPRALGTRSLLADPRKPTIKDRVNEIKQRQKFRPFAPMILEEHAARYFRIGKLDTSPYMQFVCECYEPEKFPAIVHVDGTSRVQTVGRQDHSGVRELLEKWYVLTDCPMLLNTSLNVRGEPMVNNLSDARRWEKEYGVRVCS